MKKLLTFLFIMGIMNFTYAVKNIDFPVYNSPPYIDEQKPGKGLGHDLYKEIFKTAGYNINYVFYPLQRILLNVESGKYTFGYGIKAFSSSDKVYYIPVFNVQRIIMHKSSVFFKYNNDDDFKDFTVTAVMGGEIAMKLDKLGLKYDKSNDELTVIRKIFADRIHVGILTDLTYYDLVKKYYPKQINDMKVEEKPFVIADVGIIINKKDPDWEKYAQEIENALTKMKKDGTYLKIFEKYYGKGKVPSYLLLK